MSKQWKQDIVSAIDQMEVTTSLDVCLHFHLPRILRESRKKLLPKKYLCHRSQFCQQVKKRDHEACIACDAVELPEQCRETIKAPFVHQCHAGAYQIVAPLYEGAQLCLILFLGPFKIDKTDSSVLPWLPEDQVERYVQLANMLRAYLGEIIGKAALEPILNGKSRRHGGRRLEQVVTFIEDNIQNDPSLADLAKAIHLSPSRVSHIVRELSGKSFSQLKDEVRIYAAKTLLMSTSMKIESVASGCGFNDVNYFYTFFRRKEGVTPSAFRKHHKVVDWV